jgi:hypothetical protein
MDLYLHAKSHHHPSQKHAVLTTLVNQAKTICDTKSLNTEIQHLRETFRQNGFSRTDFNRAMHHKNKTTTEKEKPIGVAVLPFQHNHTRSADY